MSTPPEWIEDAARMRRLLDEIEHPADEIEVIIPPIPKLDCE